MDQGKQSAESLPYVWSSIVQLRQEGNGPMLETSVPQKDAREEHVLSVYLPSHWYLGSNIHDRDAHELGLKCLDCIETDFGTTGQKNPTSSRIQMQMTSIPPS